MLKHGCMPCSCLRVGGDSRHLCSHIAYTHPEAPHGEIFPKYRQKKDTSGMVFKIAVKHRIPALHPNRVLSA